ncbi:Pumilio family RNA-binding protein [Entamoeba marina]
MDPTTSSLLSRLLDEDDDFGKDGLDSSLYFGGNDELNMEDNTLNGKPEEIGKSFARAYSVPMNDEFALPFVSPDSASFSFLSQSIDPWKNVSSMTNDPSIAIPIKGISNQSPRPSPRVQTLISTPPAFKKLSPSPKVSRSLKTPMAQSSTKSHTVTDLCKDQQGSRRIQQFLDAASDKEVEEIFNFVESDALELMTDLFGNYVIQKLIEFGTDTQRSSFMKMIEHNVVRLSTHTYGCRVIQKAIEFITENQISIIAYELRNNIVGFVEDQNGNHVIQKFIEYMGSSHTGIVVNEITGHVVRFSKHPYGCRVVQRLIERPENNVRSCISNELKGNIWDLAVNQYGNYVVQHLLEHGIDKQRKMVITEMKGRFFEYSMKKYSSNVVEKCVHCCTAQQRDEFITEICMNEDPELLLKLMKDAYANYVIQTLVEVMDDEQRHNFISTYVYPNIAQLKKVSYSKHLLQRLNVPTGN